MKTFLKFFVFASVFGIGVYGTDLVDLLDIAMYSGNGENCTENQIWDGSNCICDVGYVQQNEDCVQDPCANQTCNGQGTCSHNCSTGICGFVCVCDNTWTGSICSLQDYCDTTGACNNGSCTQGTGANDFTCNCGAGFSGTICDIPVCAAEGVYPDTEVGVTVSSNLTCEGGPYVGKSNESRKCDLDADGNAVWSEKSINCSISLNETTDPLEKSQLLEVLTSDPTQIQADDVSNYVTAIGEVCSGTIAPEVVDSLVTTINNLMQAPPEANVVSQSQEILGNLECLASNVNVTASVYNTIESLLGLAVFEGTTRLRSTTGRSLSIKKLLFKEDGFAGVSIVPSNDASTVAGTNYIATSATDSKVGFQLYQNDLLFPDATLLPDEIINSIIFSVNQTGDVSLKFQLFEHYDLNEEGIFENSTHITTATCVQYVSESWQNAGCSSTVLFEGASNFLECSCLGTSGSFAVKMVVTKKDDETTTSLPVVVITTTASGGGGLSTGELVGIIVGSVAGVILIIGIGYGIYTSCKNKKKKEPTKVKPAEQMDLKDVHESEAQDEGPRPSSQNAW